MGNVLEMDKKIDAAPLSVRLDMRLQPAAGGLNRAQRLELRGNSSVRMKLCSFTVSFMLDQ